MYFTSWYTIWVIIYSSLCSTIIDLQNQLQNTGKYSTCKKSATWRQVVQCGSMWLNVAHLNEPQFATLRHFRPHFATFQKIFCGWLWRNVAQCGDLILEPILIFSLYTFYFFFKSVRKTVFHKFRLSPLNNGPHFLS